MEAFLPAGERESFSIIGAIDAESDLIRSSWEFGGQIEPPPRQLGVAASIVDGGQIYLGVHIPVCIQQVNEELELRILLPAPIQFNRDDFAGSMGAVSNSPFIDNQLFAKVCLSVYSREFVVGDGQSEQLPFLRTIDTEPDLILAGGEIRRQIQPHFRPLRAVCSVAERGEIDLGMDCPIFIQQVNEKLEPLILFLAPS